MGKIKDYIGYILFAVTVLGWAYDNGVKSGKISSLETKVNQLEDENKDIKEFLIEQVAINTKLGTIVERLDRQ